MTSEIRTFTFYSAKQTNKLALAEVLVGGRGASADAGADAGAGQVQVSSEGVGEAGSMDLWTQKCRAERKNRLSVAELERLKNGESTARQCKMGKARIAKNGSGGSGGSGSSGGCDGSGCSGGNEDGYGRGAGTEERGGESKAGSGSERQLFPNAQER